ncbi:MAG: hypothetical protein SFX74_10020 [Fimbriimonadaceae bacterium]|nr:hypothetical protein [Fimbriimonadaceae bacterium]
MTSKAQPIPSSRTDAAIQAMYIVGLPLLLGTLSLLIDHWQSPIKLAQMSWQGQVNVIAQTLLFHGCLGGIAMATHVRKFAAWSMSLLAAAGVMYLFFIQQSAVGNGQISANTATVWTVGLPLLVGRLAVLAVMFLILDVAARHRQRWLDRDADRLEMAPASVPQPASQIGPLSDGDETHLRH